MKKEYWTKSFVVILATIIVSSCTKDPTHLSIMDIGTDMKFTYKNNVSFMGFDVIKYVKFKDPTYTIVITDEQDKELVRMDPMNEKLILCQGTEPVDKQMKLDVKIKVTDMGKESDLLSVSAFIIVPESPLFPCDRFSYERIQPEEGKIRFKVVHI